jgi:hypothetical protein
LTVAKGFASEEETVPDPHHERERVDLDISWLVPADLDAVDALARLQVTAARCGRDLRFHGADGGLAELLDFLGLADVVHICRCCGPPA